MQVDHVVGGISSRASGVATVITALTSAQSRLGVRGSVFSADCGSKGLGSVPVIAPVEAVSPPGHWLGRLCYSPRLRAALDGHIPHADIVHIHSLWTLPNAYGSTLARKHGKPVVFSPHGSLEPWALKRSRKQKRVCELLFQKRNLRHASVIHALNPTEAQHIRLYGLTNPVAVIPNGIDISEFHNLPDPSTFYETYPQLAGKKFALFLSRLHPKKGLNHLVEAWKEATTKRDDWHLVIAGPDDGHFQSIRNQVESLGLQHHVLFTGPLFGPQKLAALSAADLFVLPSFSEGFSMAVLEAMACGLPVLISNRCHFPEAASANAGLECEPSARSTEDALRSLLSLDSKARHNMGQNGRELVRLRYTWERVAHQFVAVYKWAACGLPWPSEVEMG